MPMVTSGGHRSTQKISNCSEVPSSVTSSGLIEEMDKGNKDE